MHFYKYQGTGNDFIIFDNRNKDIIFSAENIQFICDRRFGIGADGLMLLQLIEGFDFEMKYYNCDGIEATMCGNGGRCMVNFAASLGIITHSCKFSASDGIHEAEIIGKNVKLGMSDILNIEKIDNDYYLDTGNPHYVRFCNNIDLVDIIEESRKIRYDQRFQPTGTNVNYVELKQEKLFVRTYEKGVENETLSCGTGVVAAAIASSEVNNSIRNFTEITTPGGKLNVYFNKNASGYNNIYLEGNAVFVFEGEITRSILDRTY